MTATVRHLMDCGFRVVYGYTQSDEISLLFHPDEDAFRRKLRKWLSILAGEASACFALNRMGQDTRALLGLSVAAKNELLFQHGINFNELPAWHKRGIGAYWETVVKPGLDPRSGQATAAIRRRLIVDLELPRGEAYDALIQRLLSPEAAEGGPEG
jgi:tRNA(His) 5'-end guanylyltransferase